MSPSSSGNPPPSRVPTRGGGHCRDDTLAPLTPRAGPRGSQNHAISRQLQPRSRYRRLVRADHLHRSGTERSEEQRERLQRSRHFDGLGRRRPIRGGRRSRDVDRLRLNIAATYPFQTNTLRLNRPSSTGGLHGLSLTAAGTADPASDPLVQPTSASFNSESVNTFITLGNVGRSIEHKVSGTGANTVYTARLAQAPLTPSDATDAGSFQGRSRSPPVPRRSIRTSRCSGLPPVQARPGSACRRRITTPPPTHSVRGSSPITGSEAIFTSRSAIGTSSPACCPTRTSSRARRTTLEPTCSGTWGCLPRLQTRRSRSR